MYKNTPIPAAVKARAHSLHTEIASRSIRMALSGVPIVWEPYTQMLFLIQCLPMHAKDSVFQWSQCRFLYVPSLPNRGLRLKADKPHSEKPGTADKQSKQQQTHSHTRSYPPASSEGHTAKASTHCFLSPIRRQRWENVIWSRNWCYGYFFFFDQERIGKRVSGIGFKKKKRKKGLFSSTKCPRAEVSDAPGQADTRSFLPHLGKSPAHQGSQEIPQRFP